MRFPFLWNKGRKKKAFAVEICSVSHRGKVRIKNEDNLCVGGEYLPMDHQSMEKILCLKAPCGAGGLAAVFDGMGGECAGELASYTAAKTLAGFGTADEYSTENLTKAVRCLNEAVCGARYKRRLPQIGTTVTMIAFQHDKVWLTNLGDSPAFRLSRGKLCRVSCPHTNEKFLKEQGIDKKPGLTQFLGIDEEEFLIEPYVAEFEPKIGDIYLLCSDGLTDMVSLTEIKNILASGKDAKAMTEKLLDTALKNGGRDNITVILCCLTEDDK